MAKAALLKNLKLDRIDFVDDGANPGARITLFKRKETPMAAQDAKDSTEAIEVAKREAAEAKAQVAELTKRAEEAEKVAKANAETVEKMRDRLDRDEAIAIAKGMAPVAPADDLAEVVRIAKRVLPAETYTKLETILKAAAEKIKAGDLFSEKGTGGAQSGATPLEKLNAMVDAEYATVAKSNHRATRAQVYADLLKSNPEARALYAASEKEGR